MDTPSSDDSSQEQRVLEVQDLIIQAKTVNEICGYAKEKWHVSESATTRLLSEARKRFADISDDEWKSARGQLISQCYNLYQKAYAKEDFRTCLEILKHLTKMFKLDESGDSKQTKVVNFQDNPHDYG